MAIAAGIHCMYPGTAAAVAALSGSGWTRATDMDGRYPKGTAAGVDPNVTGGAATHTHTDPGHTHTITGHTHSGNSSGTDGTTSAGFSGGVSGAPAGHRHNFLTSSSTSGTITSTAGTWGSANNDPSYYDVIWIVSDGTPTGFPSLAWAFWDKVASLPTNWSNPAAARNVFARGAAAAGNGGGTGGGAHVHTGSGHTHTLDTHTHTGTSGGPDATDVDTFAVTAIADPTHTHSYTTAGASATSGSTASGDSASTTYEPTWAKLAIVQNDSGSANIQSRHVAVWLGLLANIPSPWVLCDGTNSTVDMRGKFVKGANGIGEIGNTGGTAGHSHSDPSGHTHTTNHSHSITLNNDSSGSAVSNFSSYPGATRSHAHAAATSGTASASSGSTVQTAPSNADTQPPFRTVAFVAYVFIQVSLAGSQAAGSGLLRVTKMPLNGSQPAASGRLYESKLPVRGAQPASTGTLAVLYKITLSGAQAAASSRLDETKMPVRGNQAAPSGTVQVVIVMPIRRPASYTPIIALRAKSGSS